MSSVFGITPNDGITNIVADFLYSSLKTRNENNAKFEIEAKFGRIIDKKTRDRIYIPVLSEVVLIDDDSFVFQSDMDLGDHSFFNKLLNERFQYLQESKMDSISKSKLRYLHTKQTDEFYNNGDLKVRVSKKKDSNEIIEILTKNLIHNLHIHFPAGKFDVRVSVNFETPQNEALILNLKPKLKRFKDRMTYNIQEGIQIDLTKVDKIETVDTGSKRKYNGNSGAEETSFELELELNSDKIQFARDKLDKKEPEEYLNLVKKFVNNLRDIAHKMKKT